MFMELSLSVTYHVHVTSGEADQDGKEIVDLPAYIKFSEHKQNCQAGDLCSASFLKFTKLRADHW